MPFCSANSDLILFLDNICISFFGVLMGPAHCCHAGERQATVNHGIPVFTTAVCFGQADAVLLTW